MNDSPERPQLLAFLVCQDILNQEGVSTLYRVVDTFNVDFGVEKLPEGIQEGDFAANISCFLFIRWGPGEGEFEQVVTLVDPDGKEAESPVATRNFTKPAGYHFAQFRIRATLVLSKSGVYLWRLFLNGEQVAEHPFTVNIRVTPIQDAPSP